MQARELLFCTLFRNGVKLSKIRGKRMKENLFKLLKRQTK